MLETLKHGGGMREPASGDKPAEVALQDRVVDWEIGAEVPFIEVGGPNKKVELSPGLLQHPAQVAPQPPHHAVEITKPKAVQLTPLAPMTVAYEAWPAPMPTSVHISADIIAFHQPEHPASKAYAGLLDAMLNGMSGNGNLLLLIGAKAKVGASTVLLNLATIAAQAKKLRVILVDANMERGSLAQKFGLTCSAGLGEVIDGALALEQAIAPTGIASLCVFPAGKKKANLTPEAMAWLLTWLRSRFDLILIDGPALDDSAALTMHAPHANGIYLVLPRGEAGNAHMAQSISRMGGRLCGLIHTHFEV
jgi:Mrp family chromosome partitioning ATPase